MHLTRGEILLLVGLAVFVLVVLCALLYRILAKYSGEAGDEAPSVALPIATAAVIFLMYCGAVLLPHERFGGPGELIGFEPADRSNLGAALVGSGLIGLAFLFMQSELARRDQARADRAHNNQADAARKGLLTLFGKMVVEAPVRDDTAVDDDGEPVELPPSVQAKLDAVADAEQGLLSEVQPDPWGAVSRLVNTVSDASMVTEPSADGFRTYASRLGVVRQKGPDGPLTGPEVDDFDLCASNAADRTAVLARLLEGAFLQAAAVHVLPSVLRVQVATEWFTNTISHVLGEAAKTGTVTDRNLRRVASMLENLCDAYADLFDVVNDVKPQPEPEPATGQGTASQEAAAASKLDQTGSAAGPATQAAND